MTDTDAGIRAAHDLATELGVDIARPVVLADRSNLVLRLEPANGKPPFIARVAMATSLVRVGMAWLRREVEVTTFLAARGIAVTKPARLVACGPHERDGFIISFWEEETLIDERPAPEAAGAALRDAHASLREYAGELPAWGGFEEARHVLARARTSPFFSPSELHRLEAAWDEATRIVEGSRARTASFQPVHGDAHIGNVLATQRGPVWTDWEDAFIGPIEFDIACLRSKADLFGEEREAIDTMTTAYGAELNRDLVNDLGVVRNVQVIPWLAVFAERDPELLPRMRARIERLPPLR